MLFCGSDGQVQLLAEDLAKPLREKMGSPQYTEVVLNLCFMETVEATKVFPLTRVPRLVSIFDSIG